MVTILVLWDIDHTLIETRGVGGQIYADAFLRVTGRRLEEMPALSGRTEPVIFREALKVHHITDTRDLYGQFAAEQARGYAERVDELRRQGRALPGALNALRKLADWPDTIQSVLTGNTREAAEVKLRAFDLDQYIDFDIGAYGTDDDTRANLVKIARQRATAARGTPFDSATTVLIGDTPNDVIAARDGGARIIAVATGRDSAADLAAAGADTVLHDLTRTDDLLSAIYRDQLRE
ncbi:MAG TPA: haloacid dehalogenase-like hydrolase [Streptosporangiaceae bacterium]|nr:haloacid dehalogenase-like hydrolase [Streptosporangiaceae bacterium]